MLLMSSKLNLEVSINCVDGQTSHHFITKSKEEALKFLKEYDHEGSSISINLAEQLQSGSWWVETKDGFEVYKYLTNDKTTNN